ncbi:hypothetical protein THASP1DRAFT_27968 [Thamnocephalis sphaerospora]|uniref:PB1 domain-containing protein n=1 Tax=Thamnocephalis sphaerospora TaxID=78915 RepID=A0A4P9XXU6_9FUNG|nr:hypothetical protein THASP1DRAFT_27968 [Thamnocephalis sphaerospora]|eukprot:RKP10240.1 hypothetical protein THASP1DRAFT_27968 [Thamnocephalis sphaerospora]
MSGLTQPSVSQQQGAPATGYPSSKPIYTVKSNYAGDIRRIAFATLPTLNEPPYGISTFRSYRVMLVSIFSNGDLVTLSDDAELQFAYQTSQKLRVSVYDRERHPPPTNVAFTGTSTTGTVAGSVRDELFELRRRLDTLLSGNVASGAAPLPAAYSSVAPSSNGHSNYMGQTNDTQQQQQPSAPAYSPKPTSASAHPTSAATTGTVGAAYNATPSTPGYPPTAATGTSAYPPPVAPGTSSYPPPPPASAPAYPPPPAAASGAYPPANTTATSSAGASPSLSNASSVYPSAASSYPPPYGQPPKVTSAPSYPPPPGAPGQSPTATAPGAGYAAPALAPGYAPPPGAASVYPPPPGPPGQTKPPTTFSPTGSYY